MRAAPVDAAWNAVHVRRSDVMIPNFDFINGIANGPETQIDPKMGEMLKGLEDKSVEEVRSALHKALDFGARYALASTFVMTTLDVEWKRIGGSHNDPTPWRKEIEEAEGC